MISRWGSRGLQFLAAAALLLPVSPAFAQWTGKGQLGAALATGNSETLNANARVEARHVHGDWEENMGFNGVYASTDDDTTSQIWELFGDGRYNFNPRNFWFGAARYQSDRFSGFRYQGSVSTGIGHTFIDNDRTKLQGRIGAGFKFQETRDSFDPVSQTLIPGQTDNSAVGVGGLDWDFQVTDTTKLFDYFYVETTSKNTFLRNEIGVSVAMSERLALAVAYMVRHNTDPPLSFSKTDSLLTANIVYEVK